MNQPRQMGTEKKAARPDTDKFAAIKAMLHKKADDESKKAQSVADAFTTMDSLSKEISPETGLDMSKIRDEDDEHDVTGVPTDIGNAFADKLSLLRSQVQKVNDERTAERKAAAEKQESTAVMRKEYDNATRHLSRIISNQSLRTIAPKLYEMARDMWQDIKSAKEKG